MKIQAAESLEPGATGYIVIGALAFEREGLAEKLGDVERFERCVDDVARFERHMASREWRKSPGDVFGWSPAYQNDVMATLRDIAWIYRNVPLFTEDREPFPFNTSNGGGER